MKASEWRVRKTAPDFNCDSSHVHDTSDIRYCCSNGSSIELQLQNARRDEQPCVSSQPHEVCTRVKDADD